MRVEWQLKTNQGFRVLGLDKQWERISAFSGKENMGKISKLGPQAESDAVSDTLH